jgi:hypothetical protein
MAELVEARRDGRLRERERASLERHLSTCASCRAAERELARIAAHVREPLEGDVSPIEHQRGRLALLRAAVRPEPRRARWTVAVAPAAAALALAALLAARRPAPVPLALHLPPPSPPAAALAAARVGATIRGSPGARFDRTTRLGVDRVDLVEGTLDLEVDPLGPGQRFLVATEDAEVEVRGTVFRVEAHAGQLFAVSVTQGKVAVRRRGETSLLLAGDSWPTARGAPPDPSTSPPAVAIGRRARGPRTAAPATPAAPPRSEASKAFAEGMALIERGDDVAAAEKLDAFRAAHPGDPRAEDAAFLTVVSLQRAGRAADAKAAARRFLDLYPASARAPAVRAIADAP